ncbi:MAG: TonB-dependent receptor [Desulfobacteraceae bacterium]
MEWIWKKRQTMGVKCFAGMMLAFLLAGVAVAEEQSSQKLDDVVVTATKTPKKLENVPAVVTIIGPEEIEATPARTVGDLLFDLPGVYPTEPQGVGVVTPQKVTMRGNGFAGHTLVLLDGQRINNPSTDYTYLTTMPVRAVERIEVIRGPFSALYGSSASGGIVNIITKDGGNRTHVEPWARAGDFGRHDYGLDAGAVSGDFSIGLFIDHKYADNYYLYDDMGLDDTNRDYEHNRLHAKFTGTLGEATDLSLSGGTIDAETGYGIGENLGIERYQNLQQSYLNFQITSRLTDKFELKGQADWLQSSHEYHGETLVNVVTFPPPPQFNYQSSLNDTDSERYHGDLTLNWYLSPEHILTLGGEVIHTRMEKSIRDADTGELLEVQGRPGEESDEDDTLYSAYAQYDWMVFDFLELVIGARFDDYESYGSEFSPKGTLRWQYNQGGNLKLSAGKGFRAPNVNQLYSVPWSISPFIVYQGNPDLEAETLWSYEVSLEQYALGKKLFFRLTPYYTDADNLITSVRAPDPLNPGGQIMYPDNVDEVEIKGVDLEISYKVIPVLTLFANYNYNETRDSIADEILDGYPLHTAALGLRVNFPIADDWRLFGSYTARFRGDYDETSWGQTPVTETFGDYWYHTASVGIDWREMVKLNVDVFNLLNDRTETDFDRYLQERNYLVEISFNYAF